ncbi:hemolysin family protein [Flectobacillus longus]|uniref:Hemolysin family protein n=1 Tax=Flectobacillus longus TaxID=2984207 RepID=A0ABT6YSD5_9BACT|nr:hemolysin family protein [Flectobacillus longus]MDI9866051.1 hemolysin family protein [Flectobacillus longus]MDI9881235.1 hemolysin family protein [Flectobacillus longus]
MDSQQAIGVILSMVFSAFFSGVEMAFVSANKLYFELQAKQGVITGQIISRFIKNPSKFIGTLLIGNTLSLVAYGIFMEGYLHHQIEHYFPVFGTGLVPGLIASILGTVIILGTSEFTPKSVFLLNPDGFLEVLSIPIWIIYTLMYPLVWAIVGLSSWFIKNVLRLEYSEEKPAFGLTDLNHYMQNLNRKISTEEEAEVDTKIFNNALEFKQVKVRDCMIPRTEIVAIDFEDGIEELKKTFVESGHSKVLVYKDTLEDVVGYCHSVALFKKPKDIQSILKPILIVPEAMPAKDLMLRFSKERKSLALIVDEFGSTSGLVSMEDVMEQIFGDIEDEYDDNEDLIEKRLEDKVYLLSARLEIDYLNEKYEWNLPEGDYDTLGGMIISINEDIPEVNETIIAHPFNFQIISMMDARIDTVKLTIIGEIERKTESFSMKH